MSLADVVAALNRAIVDGVIDLYAASGDPALAPIRPLLARFTVASAFTLTGARLTPGATAAVLIGNGHWGLPDATSANVLAVSARLDCVATGGDRVDFTLTLTMPTGWTFDKTFAALPETQAFADGALVPAASFLNSVRVDNAALAGGTADNPDGPLTLAGALPMAPLWAPWKALVGPWPLQLAGTCTLPTSATLFPVLDLYATSALSQVPLNSSLLQLGGLTLTDVGFNLASYLGPDGQAPQVDAYSILNLTGRLQVGGLVTRLDFPLLAASDVWHFIVSFDEGEGGIVEGMNQLARLFGLPDLPTPPNFLPIPAFRFSSIEFYLQPGASLLDLTVTAISVAIESTSPWKAPVPFVTVEKAGTSWLWTSTPINGSAAGVIAGNVYGVLAFGDADPFHIGVAVQIPGWTVTADLQEGDVIPITAAFRNYFGDGGPPTPADMNVVGLAIEADPSDQAYYASADIIFGQPPEFDPLEPPIVDAQGWEINLIVTTITLRSLSFHVDMVGGVLAGGIGAIFYLGEASDEDAPAIQVGAEYPGPAESNPEGWTFSGELLAGSSIGLPYMVKRYLGQDPAPSWVPDLSIDRLYFSCNTGTPTEYAFGGTVSLRWQPTIFGTTLKVSAAASIDMAKPGDSDTASGKVSGLFSINKLALTAALTLGVPEPTYQFKVQFDQIWFQALTSWRGEAEARHQVITLQLGGVTVGQVLEYLVNLAAPTLGYSLDPPWDILNSIELDRFTLTLDPQESTVELVYAANADLVFMKLDTIGIRYSRGQQSGVSLILTGSLLGQRFDGDDLEWDVIDGSPPALPGAGDSFIELRYLGLGQRVQLTSLPDTVAATLDLLKGELKEPVAGQNPLEGQGVEWSPTSQWLIGLDVTLLDTVDLGFIFNDPWLYGLSIALGGEEAGSLAGLRFEILYKKVSDTVGMFRIELTLPEAFRTFEFGEVSVTLGVVVIEIYTNGNFKVDLGFPYNRSFERSFTVQVFPFIGRGGIYFGLLNGVTSRSVPRITNGTFSPVIELGVGLAVGVGKEIHVGPLSGGIYVQVEVIFEGVLGWFHPSAAGGQTATYYWAQGVAAIHGKLYGSVDFAVIKVSVTLEAYAAATVTLECYRPTTFRLQVDVRAEASVKILFIRVSFSFEVGLDVSFQVGQERPTPWILAADQSPYAPHSTVSLTVAPSGAIASGSSRSVRGGSRRRVAPPRRRPERRRAVLVAEHRARLRQLRAAELAEDDVIEAPDWQPTKTVFSDSPRTAQVYFLPSFTVGDVPLSWTTAIPTNASPDYRFAMQLFAPTGAPPQAENVAQAKRRSAAMSALAAAEDDLDTLAADILVQGLLLYCLYAIPDGPQAQTDTVTAGQLAWLAGILDDPATAGPGFTTEMLGQFFETNVHLAISGMPDGADPADQDGMAVAAPPFMGWTSPQTGPVDFAADNQIGPLYLWGVAKAAALFSPTGQAPGEAPDDPSTAYQSFAAHLFSDWCLLIAKAAVREAAAALDNRVLAAATASQSLRDIANAQPTATVSYPVRPGDTVETVADALGATVDELTFLNPDLAADLLTTPAGDSISILLGVSPEVLASDNPTATLQKTSLALGDLTVPVTATDTLNGLATRYLTTAAAILGVAGQDIDAKLLAAGSTFDAPATNWTAPPADTTALRAAAIFYIRYAGLPSALDPDAPAADWYAQVLADLNATALSTAGIDPRSQELPPAMALVIPTAYGDAAPAAVGYTTSPGDTLARIGAALNLEQNQALTTGTDWATFRDGVTAITGGYAIPAFANVVVAQSETFAMLARRTVVNWVETAGVWGADWSGLAGWIGGSLILAPLALITIADVTTDAETSYTFASLAEAFAISLTEAGGRLADVEGLVEGEALTVKHLPADTVQSLLDIVTAEAVAGIAGEASRFLFSGQEIPVPVTVDGHVEASPNEVSPLFDQSRQQWDITVDDSQPDAVALSLVLSSQVDWITLFDSTVAGEGEDTAALRARAPEAFGHDLNRALTAGRALPAGAVLLGAEADTLSYSVTNAEVMAQVPETGLSWPPHIAPAPIEVKGEAPVTYGLGQHAALQTAIALPVPGFDVARNTLSIHPFPSALLTRARAGSATDYAIYASLTDTADAAPVTACAFAALIGFTVRRLAEAPGVYQLIGAEVEQLPLLLDLIAYLGEPSTPAGTVAHVSLPPSTTAADPNGVALVDGDAWLIKSNLSTETVPPSVSMSRAQGDDAIVCRADLADPKTFALLLWEGSTVGGAGYTFGVDGGLSDGAFDANDQATLQLLVIAGAQQQAASDGQPLLSFNTALLAVDQAAPDGATLFAEAHDSADPTEFVAQALVPAGSTGFDLTLTRPFVPAIPPDTDAENALRQQYSLIVATAAVTADCPYAIPASGLPASPQAVDGLTAPAWKRARARRRGAMADPAPMAYWAYQTVLPIYRFGPPSVAPQVAGLPAPDEDPYRGLGAATTAPQVDFSLGFGDVLGNRSAVADNQALPVPVGYSDPLNGPTTWPATNAWYAVTKTGETVTLDITFAAKAQGLTPAANQRGDALVEAAARQRDLYGVIYYQYVQPGLTATVETTLQTGAVLDLDGEGGLLAFAAGAYLAADTAARFGPVMPAAGALGAVVSDYGIGWEALATVNAAVPLASIFGAGVGLTVPAYVVMASGDSAQSISLIPRAGWPTPTAAEILGATPNQDDLPLRVGAVLSYPARAVTLADPAPTLTDAATTEATSAGWLASDSQLDAILSNAFVFVVDGVRVTVGQTPVPGAGGVVETFADAILAFADAGVHLTAYDLGQQYATDPALLIAAASAHVAHYVVTGQATLGANPSGASTSDLIDANTTTQNLYEAGALIYLGDFGTGSPAVVTPAAEDTLSGFAARYACPPAALLAANAGLQVIAGSALAIPGATALPTSDLASAPYTLRAGDILSAVASGFDLTPDPDKATALALRNADMPGTVAQGQSFDVDVGGTEVPVDTTGLTSFAAVLAEVQQTAPTATMADVAAAFEVAGRLATGGLLACPPALLAAVAKPQDIAGLYGVSDSAFALVNAGVTGLLVPGLELVAPDPTVGTVTTTAHDTLNSVVGRFNALYLAAGKPATATVANVVQANAAQALFAAGARALLAPADISLSATLADDGPYPSAAFALTVELTVRRPTDLVLPAFAGTSAEIATATIAAPTASPDPNGSMTFNAFEQALTTALPNLRLATAKMDDQTADLWAVNFGADGITSADIFPAVTFGEQTLARMIALAPLYGRLVSRAQVPIAPLVDGALVPAAAVDHDYQGIDVEVWASRFLADFDRLLGPASAAAINDIVDLRPQYVSLMDAKATLQTAIPADLASIFKVNPTTGPQDPRAVDDPNLTDGLAEAVRVFGQSLGLSLSSAWATAAIVQYDATVDSTWTRAPDPDQGEAALYGQARSKVTQEGDVANPPWRLAAGKVSLSETAPFLTLPLAVSDPGAQSQIPLDLEYAVSNLEIHRKPVAAAPGYTASDWLAMTPLLTGDEVPAALGVDLGATDVPIPLKAFPALPLIISQTGAGDPTVPPTLDTAALWTFRLVYSHEHAAQDHVLVTAEFNLSPPMQDMRLAQDTDDLFTGLAQYVAVADDLNTLLAGLTDPAGGTATPAQQAAVATFASLANTIAGLWNVRLPDSPGVDTPAGGDDWVASEAYPFSAVITYKEGGQRLMEAYTLTRLDGAIGPALDWPQVQCQAPDGTWVDLVGATPVGDSRAYAPAEGTDLVVTAWPRLALSWPSLNLGVTQNGRVKLEVVRNTDLLGADGPATAEVFVYRTATVTATDIVTPGITRTDPLAMTGTSVQAALQAAFDALFPPADRRDDLKLTLGLFYGYTLVPGDDALVSELAVGLIPDQTLTSATAGMVADALAAWQTSVKPNPSGGLWSVSLMLYSSFDPGKRVLLSLDRMTYPLG